MLNALRRPVDYVRDNTDSRIVVSAVVGGFALAGAALLVDYIGRKTGVKVVRDVAAAAA